MSDLEKKKFHADVTWLGLKEEKKNFGIKKKTLLVPAPSEKRSAHSAIRPETPLNT